MLVSRHVPPHPQILKTDNHVPLLNAVIFYITVFTSPTTPDTTGSVLASVFKIYAELILTVLGSFLQVDVNPHRLVPEPVTAGCFWEETGGPTSFDIWSLDHMPVSLGGFVAPLSAASLASYWFLSFS